MIMGHPELLWLLHVRVYNLSCQLLWRVLLIVWELSNRLVPALSWRMRRLEWWSVFVDGWLWRWFDYLWRNWDVFLQDFPRRVEVIKFTNSLSKWCILELGDVLFMFLSSKCLWSVEIVFLVRNERLKVGLLSRLTLLWWISDEVSWTTDDFTRVLVTLIVLGNVVQLLHVLVGCNHWFLHSPGWLELVLVTSGGNLVLVDIPCNDAGACLLERLANGIIGRCTEQDLVNGGSLLDWVGYNVGWINENVTLSLNSSWLFSFEH